MATDRHDSHDINSENVRNPDVAYERRDMGARGVLLFFVILFISGVIIHFIVWGVYGAMDKVVAGMDAPANPLKPIEKAPKAALLQNTPMVNLEKFPTPRLQTDDATDMQTFKWQEEQILNAQPWQDQTGTVHIPIDEAMKLVAQRGLPVRSGNQAGTPAKAQTQAVNKPMSDQHAKSDAGQQQ